MWTRRSSKGDGAKDRDDEKRKRSDSSATRRSKTSESVVSSASTRKPSGRDSRSRAPDSPASSYATFATARDDHDRDDMRSNADLYDGPRDDERRRRRRDDDERSTTLRRDRSRSRDRSDKDRKHDKKKKSRSEAGGPRPQDIVEAPRRAVRSVAGPLERGESSRFPDLDGPPMMSGGLPAGTMSSHVQDQFPGQNPQQFATPFVPHAPVHTASFGEAAEYYGDQGQSVQHQPGVRIERPSVIIPQDQQHLITGSSQANPVADTGAGAAAEFYSMASAEPQQPSKPPRPSSMPGAFTDDEPLPAKPPRPSSRPDKPGKLSSAAAMAGAAGVGYAFGHESSQTHSQQATTYTNGISGDAASIYYQGENPSTAATDGSHNYNGTSSYVPTYNEAMEGMPPPKPPRPGKPEKQPSGSSHAGLYTAGAAGLAAYSLAHHNAHHTHNHNHTHSMPGGFPGEHYGSYGSSPGTLMSGGMAQRHEHKGPVSKFADWWKNYDDVRKMEEYTEYIGVCKYCFDPRSSPMDAPRPHHYNRRKRSGELRPSGIKEKHSRYGLNEKASRTSLSGDERRDKRKSNSSSAAGWIAAGLGGVGLAKAGQALFNQRNDFDDTYSIKSGRDPRSRTSRRSRSRSRESKHYSYGRSGIRHRSPSEDRISYMSTGITGNRKDRRDYKVVQHRSHSRSRSHSRDRKSGILGAALGAGLAASAVGASRKKHHSRSRSRSHSPQNAFVHHRRDSSDRERRYSKNQRLKSKSSRSSVSGASFVEVSRPHQSQGGFLGGFFAAAPPKEKSKEKKRKTHSQSKKKKGFFNFGNASSSSSDSDIAFGEGFVRRKKRLEKRPSRRSSDEKLNATLIGLGATAAAIAAAKAGRSSGRHRPEVVAVRENRHQTQSRYRRQSGGSRYGNVDADGWEDLPDDDTTDSGSISSGLAFGDHDLYKTKSRESLNSNGSGTSKWGWRWGSKKEKKKPSTESLYNANANNSLIGPAAVGAVAGTAIGAGLHRQDSSASSIPSLQNVVPVQATADPNSFDARRTNSLPTPQPLLTSQSGPTTIQHPQPMQQVPGAMYSTQAPPEPGYIVPSGPPVFSQPPYPTAFDSPQHPAPPRRANSSPVQSSSWKRDAALAAAAGGLAGAAISSMKNKDRPSRPSSSQSNVRFGFTEEQAHKERQRLKDIERDEEDERRRRLDETERREQERRKLELQRQQEEARKYQEAEQLAKLEIERREAERRREHEAKERREQEERIARRAREKAEEQERREHEARIAEQRRHELELEEEQKHRERLEQERRMAEQRKRDIEFEQELEQKRRERRELDQRVAEQREAEQREAEIQQDLERRRREREAEEYSSRYESDRDRRTIEQQRTGSSVTSDVRRKEQELEDRERDIVQPDVWKKPAAVATAAVAAAAITSAAISSSKHDDRRTKKEASSKYDKYDDRRTKEVEPSSVKTVEPAAVKTIAPSMIAQDYADDDIFNPDIFKKRRASPIRQPGSAQEVLQEWEDRYTHEQVSQADFFAPKELLDKTAAPVAKVDPNEGAPDLLVYQAHDDHDYGPPRRPPYPTSYSFTATKDGRGPANPPYPVPELNLIQPTPPGSRAPTPRVVSVPASPAMEPVPEPTKEDTKQEEANRRGSRVSWGANQFHNYEVPTPDSIRENFVSDHDLDKYTKQSQDKIYVEADSPKSGRKTTTYEPKLPEPEVPASTQYVPGQDNDDWAGTMSKKVSKKDKKKAKAAAAAAAAAATVVTTAALASRDDDRHIRARDDADNVSIMTDPFADKYAASTVSAAPSTMSSWSTPFPESASDVTVVPAKPTRSIQGELISDPEPMHMPGGFDDSSAPTTEAPTEDEWTAPSKKGKKGKKSKSTDEDTFALSEPPRTIEQIREPEPEPVREVIIEPETKSSKKDKKKKKKSTSADEVPFAQDARTAVVPEPEPVIVEERRPEPETLVEDDSAAPSKLSKNDKNNKSKGAVDEFFDQASSSTFDSRAVAEPEYAREQLPEPKPEPEKPMEDEGAAYARLSKKDKKKAKKAAKKGTADSFDDTESSQPSTPVLERDPRDIEPTFTPGTSPDEPRSNGTSANATNAAMAGGFAALVGAAMKQDQDRITSDFEHARESMEYARALPSTAFHDVEELGDVKTPKKQKRVSSGRWSPSIGSPLRSEVQYKDYVGSIADPSNSRAATESSKSPPRDLGLSHVFPSTIRDAHASGHYAPDDPVQPNSADRDSDEFFSAGSDEQQPAKDKTPPADKFSDREKTYMVSPPKTYDDDLEREERRHVRYETRSRSQSRDRGYELDKGDSPNKRRHHRRRETDERSDDWDSRSVISEARSEATSERRRKHRHREGERTRSPEEYRRSSARSEPGDLENERKSSRRRSKRDDDDNMSVSSAPRYDEEKSSTKDKEKRSSGLFGLFSRSKENLADTSKSSKPREDEDAGERRRRRKKHREGSAYGSDDDDARSTISSSSRREKRRSRTDGWEEKV